MFIALKPYPNYKDSGVPWLGEVPVEWEVKPNRSLFAEVKNPNHPNEPLLSVTISRGVIRQTELLANSSKKDSSNLDKSKYKLLNPGEVAYNKMRAWQGAVGLSKHRGIISPAYIVQRPRTGVCGEYIHYLFRTPHFAKEAERWSYGITSDQWSLRSEHFKMIYSCLPPFSEQEQIVRFLRAAENRIKRLIRNKRRLIGLLREQKQAIINQAVTRGIDPNVPLKPSGIFYWRDIPEGWSTRRFKSVSVINSGQVDPRKPEFKELILIAPNHIEKGTGRLLYKETADAQGADSGKYIVKKGQIVYSKIRPHLRKAAISQFDGLCSADMYPITFDSTVLDSDYALLLLLSMPFTKYTEDCSMRVAMPKINREALGTGWFVFPSVQEQREILEYIAVETKTIDTAVSRAEREIELINEYCTRLISDVVTGKVDVRDVFINDDELEELEFKEETELEDDVTEIESIDD